MRAAAERLQAAAAAKAQGQGQPGRRAGRRPPVAPGSRIPRPPNRKADRAGVADPDSLAELQELVRAKTGRRWGELPGHLRSEILQMSQGRYRDDYARLIQLYFREIAAGAGARPQDAEPMNRSARLHRPGRSSARGLALAAILLVPPARPRQDLPAPRPASPAADRAVKRGLDYLKSAQKPDGAWESGGFGKATSVTSLAVMAFLAAGPRAGRAGAVPRGDRAAGSATSWPTSGPTACSSPTPATARCTATGSAR